MTLYLIGVLATLLLDYFGCKRYNIYYNFFLSCILSAFSWVGFLGACLAMYRWRKNGHTHS